MTRSPAPLPDGLGDHLRAVVGGNHVLVDPELTASYETDWTGRFSGRSPAVVRPGTTAEVAGVVVACAKARAPIVAQGGNTGLVGGGVPMGGELVVSLTRLTELGPVDTAAAQVTAGAGVRLADLQRHVRAAGLDFGVDFAARDSATVGGLTATNAGGERVLRYGGMRAQLAGIEAVLADGSVLSRMSGLLKDNTGYDLPGLLAGSEGTLGVVTGARLRLVPSQRNRVVAVVAVGGVDEAVELLAVLRQRLRTLEAAELFFATGLELVRAHSGMPAPFAAGHPAYLLVECADRRDPTDELTEALADSEELVRDAALATDAAGRHGLWAYREGHTEAINAEGVPVKLDIAVPLAVFPAVARALPTVVSGAAPHARTVLFGHINEGNLHVNVLDATDRAEEVTDAVLRHVAARGGSISAEHGVGRAKLAWLGLSRSPTEIAAMRAVKRALDPQGLLNPGVLLPPPSCE
jgi:FAD/FMN-containing dehydrogenase